MTCKSEMRLFSGPVKFTINNMLPSTFHALHTTRFRNNLEAKKTTEEFKYFSRHLELPACTWLAKACPRAGSGARSNDSGNACCVEGLVHLPPLVKLPLSVQPQLTKTWGGGKQEFESSVNLSDFHWNPTGAHIGYTPQTPASGP